MLLLKSPSDPNLMQQYVCHCYNLAKGSWLRGHFQKLQSRQKLERKRYPLTTCVLVGCIVQAEALFQSGIIQLWKLFIFSHPHATIHPYSCQQIQWHCFWDSWEMFSLPTLKPYPCQNTARSDRIEAISVHHSKYKGKKPNWEITFTLRLKSNINDVPLTEF